MDCLGGEHTTLDFCVSYFSFQSHRELTKKYHKDRILMPLDPTAEGTHSMYQWAVACVADTGHFDSSTCEPIRIFCVKGVEQASTLDVQVIQEAVFEHHRKLYIDEYVNPSGGKGRRQRKTRVRKYVYLRFPLGGLA